MPNVQLVFATYADAVLGSHEARHFDRIEVHPVRILNGVAPRTGIAFQDDSATMDVQFEPIPDGCRDEPDFYAVFLDSFRYRRVPVASFSCRGSALAYGFSLYEQHTYLSNKWFLPVWDTEMIELGDEVKAQAELARNTSKTGQHTLDAKLALLNITRLLDAQLALLRLHHWDIAIHKRDSKGLLPREG